MRMGNEDLGDHVGVIFEELRVLLQVFCNGVYIHSLFSSFGLLAIYIARSACGGGVSHRPSNTFVAAPFIDTERSSPSQMIVRTPPLVATCTFESSKPRRTPATTAAHAPVPHAGVSPAPRSHTRSRMLARSTTCMYPAFTRCGKRGCRSINGPCVAAVRVEDPIAKVGVRRDRRLDDEHLIAARAEAPIGKHANLRRRQCERRARRIDDDEVVAQSLHFREAKRRHERSPITLHIET